MGKSKTDKSSEPTLWVTDKPTCSKIGENDRPSEPELVHEREKHSRFDFVLTDQPQDLTTLMRSTNLLET